MTQQNGTVWGVGTRGWAYNPQIRSQARFLCPQVVNGVKLVDILFSLCVCVSVRTHN